MSKQEADPEEEEESEEVPAANDGDNLLLDFSETGLADPWTQPSAEPPPSYDTLIDDPFASGSNDPFAQTTPISDPFSSDPFASTTQNNTLGTEWVWSPHLL